MPISYQIVADPDLVIMTASGVLTDDDMIGCIDALRQDPALVAGSPTLSDLTAIDRIEVTPEGVRRLVRHMTPTAEDRGDFRLAIVAAADLAFGMSRMFGARAESQRADVRVFRSIREARDWLELD